MINLVIIFSISWAKKKEYIIWNIIILGGLRESQPVLNPTSTFQSWQCLAAPLSEYGAVVSTLTIQCNAMHLSALCFWSEMQCIAYK